MAYVTPRPAVDALQLEVMKRLHARPGSPVHGHELNGHRKEDVDAVIARCHHAGLIVGRVLKDNDRIAAAVALNLTPSGYQWLMRQTTHPPMQ